MAPSLGPVVRSGMAYTPTGRLQVSSSDAAGSDGAGSPLIEAWPERTPMGLHKTWVTGIGAVTINAGNRNGVST